MEGKLFDALVHFGYELVEINNNTRLTENELELQLSILKKELDTKLLPYVIDTEGRKIIEVFDDVILFIFYLKLTEEKEKLPNYYAWLKIYRTPNGYKYGGVTLLEESYMARAPFYFALIENFVRETKAFAGEFISRASVEYLSKLAKRLKETELINPEKLEKEIFSVIVELEKPITRLKLDHQVFLKVLEKTYKENFKTKEGGL